MPNRIIKESICTSENIDQLSAFQETFFYRLIVNCDDYGRMDGRPKVLSSRLFPLRDIKLSQITDALNALLAAELIILYEKDGHPYLQMKTWDHHQTIRAKKSKYPDINDENVQISTSEIICKQMNADASKCSRNPIQSNPIQSESNPNPKRTKVRSTETDELFDTFWKEYPKKVKKPDAIKAWNKIPPLTDPHDVIEGVLRWKKSDQWTRDGGRYIPNPATWLNARQWEDEVQETSNTTKPSAQPFAEYEQRDYSSAQDEAVKRMMETEW